MTDSPVGSRDRYISLMKDALMFSLWPQPPVPLTDLEIPSHKGPKQLILRILQKLSPMLEGKGLVVMKGASLERQQLEDGLVWPNYGETMIGRRRMDNVQLSVETVLREDIPGDLIETGVWRGGACIFMRSILAAYEIHDRRVFVADSFEGLPPPDPNIPADRGDQHHTRRQLAVSLEEVENNFRRFDLLDEQVVFLKGWFSDTLPTAPIDQIAVLRLDGDMYGSTMDALENLYAKVSRGGFIIVDDFHLEGCRAAVDDFRRHHRIDSSFTEIDGRGIYWRK